jgi:hypothetical protein
MTSIMPPDCLKCVHYIDELTCVAFPERIPNDILYSKVKHTKPYKGDNGIQFKLDLEKEAEEQIFMARSRKLAGLDE